MRFAVVRVRVVEVLEPVECVGDAAVLVDWLGRVFVVAGTEHLQKGADGLGVLFELEESRRKRVGWMAEERAVQMRKSNYVLLGGAPAAEEAGQIGATEGVLGNGGLASGERWIVVFNVWDGRAESTAPTRGPGNIDAFRSVGHR